MYSNILVIYLTDYLVYTRSSKNKTKIYILDSDFKSINLNFHTVRIIIIKMWKHSVINTRVFKFHEIIFFLKYVTKYFMKISLNILLSEKQKNVLKSLKNPLKIHKVIKSFRQPPKSSQKYAIVRFHNIIKNLSWVVVNVV